MPFVTANSVFITPKPIMVDSNTGEQGQKTYELKLRYRPIYTNNYFVTLNRNAAEAT